MRRFAQKLDQFLALPAADRSVVLAAAALLPLFWTGLRLFGLQRMQRWLEPSTRRLADPVPVERLQHLGRLVNSATHHALGPANCLTRSLYLWWLLHRRGVDSELRIGVRLADGTLDAHAWVEHAGVPVNDRADVSADFAPFSEPVSPSRFTAP